MGRRGQGQSQSATGQPTLERLLLLRNANLNRNLKMNGYQTSRRDVADFASRYESGLLGRLFRTSRDKQGRIIEDEDLSLDIAILDELLVNGDFSRTDESKMPIADALYQIKKALKKYLDIETQHGDKLSKELIDLSLRQRDEE